ncbi:GNAT family N-acetyltransferase [Natronococcus sp. A-GB7]|uniref:GNAT family N-acetyltransferase n=1 Tax=Natronococcus sp. A-GB7 TaxID=3037649 RepID=UPI00241DEEAB|nr:GNAT family N-acetyltransferase [Natronococcus sp. A-GB7]MDG5818109.1 GNAT family N-acetyltransferase [Natronococcus sp. A-GB7]
MKLVEATADDLEALVDRWYALATEMEAYSELNELAYANVREVPDDGFRAHLDSEDVTDYLVVHDGERIGLVTLREGRHPSRRYSTYLRIVNLAIDEDRRGQGHGAAVLERVREMALERGCDHLKVSCEWENEDARRFYRDMDFQPKQVDYVQPLE